MGGGRLETQERQRPWRWHDRPWRRRSRPQAAAAREGKRKGGPERVKGNVLGSPHRRRGARTRGSKVRCSSRAWRTRLGHASPFGQILEHVAGDEWGMVGGAFGLDPGRIRTWAEYEDRSPHEALRFLLRVPSHLSCRSAVNQVQS